MIAVLLLCVVYSGGE